MGPGRITLKLFFLGKLSFEKVCEEITGNGWIQCACLCTTLLKIFLVRECQKKKQNKTLNDRKRVNEMRQNVVK